MAAHCANEENANWREKQAKLMDKLDVLFPPLNSSLLAGYPIARCVCLMMPHGHLQTWGRKWCPSIHRVRVIWLARPFHSLYGEGCSADFRMALNSSTGAIKIRRQAAACRSWKTTRTEKKENLKQKKASVKIVWTTLMPTKRNWVTSSIFAHFECSSFSSNLVIFSVLRNLRNSKNTPKSQERTKMKN